MIQKKNIIRTMIFVGICLLLFSCSGQNDNELLLQISNEAPLYSDDSFLNLDNIYNIKLISNDYQISQATDMGVDKNNNLYVLSQFESNITIFDNNGEYVRSMGQPGQGPNDLSRPHKMSIYDEKIYIVEGFSGMKVWDLNGEYINKVNVSVSNYLLIKHLKNIVMLLSYMSKSEGTIHHIVLSIADDNYKNKNEIFEYNLNRNTEFSFYPQFVLAITENGNFYFPRSSDSHNIIKYDATGKPLFGFDREYNSKAFTKKARDRFNVRFGNSVAEGKLKEMPKYPPVVRKVLIDSRENLWVVLGEIWEDSQDPVFESEIDIFDKNGMWLYSFQSNKISAVSFIQNNRLYSVSKQDPVTGQQYINVYDIHYNY